MYVSVQDWLKPDRFTFKLIRTRVRYAKVFLLFKKEFCQYYCNQFRCRNIWLLYNHSVLRRVVADNCIGTKQLSRRVNELICIGLLRYMASHSSFLTLFFIKNKIKILFFHLSSSCKNQSAYHIRQSNFANNSQSGIYFNGKMNNLNGWLKITTKRTCRIKMNIAIKNNLDTLL